MADFKTILKEASEEYIVQKSRFIGHAAPVESEEEAIQFINKIRTLHRSATHNCYAYIIGQNAGIMRYSDDGEPSGTAGVPILNVLSTKGLVNVCAVITRYFGGILLGAGGLVRAYGHSTSLGIDKAGIILKVPTQRLLIRLDYPIWNSFCFLIKSLPVETEETEFAEAIITTLLVRRNDVESVLDNIKNLLNQEVDCIASDVFIHYWPVTSE